MTQCVWETGIPGVLAKRGWNGPNDGVYGAQNPERLMPYFTVFTGPGGTEEGCQRAAKEILQRHGGHAVVVYTVGGVAHRQHSLV